MAKFAIKVDWMNMRIEFSPNLKIENTNLDNDRTVALVETVNEYSENEYPVYILSEDKIDSDEPFDEEDKFWKGFILPSGAEQPSPSIQRSQVNTPTVQNNLMSAPNSEEDKKLVERRKIESQMAAIQKMVSKLDNDFQMGAISQDLFVKKKDYLAQKLGSLMGELEKL